MEGATGNADLPDIVGRHTSCRRQKLSRRSSSKRDSYESPVYPTDLHLRDTATSSMSNVFHGKLVANLKRQFEQRQFCDVKLKTKNKTDGKTVSVGCHKVILASSSAYFDRLLSNHAKSTDATSGGVAIIDVDPLSPEVLRDVIAFLYTGECEIRVENVQDLLSVSLEWSLGYLAEMCTRFIRSDMNIENAVSYHELAVKLKNQELIEETSCFIRGYFNAVANTESINNLSYSNLHTLLQSSTVNVESEDVVFKCVMSWIEHNQTSVSSQEEHELLNLIRLEHLSDLFLCDVVMGHEKFNSGEQLDKVKSAVKRKLITPDELQMCARTWDLPLPQNGRFTSRMHVPNLHVPLQRLTFPMMENYQTLDFLH